MSRTFQIRYTVEAEADLGKIWSDLSAARGAEFASGFMQDLKGRIESLQQQPKRYRVRSKLGRNRRLMPEYPYHVIYRVRADEVLIVRVMHGSRNITRRTIESPGGN